MTLKPVKVTCNRHPSKKLKRKRDWYNRHKNKNN